MESIVVPVAVDESRDAIAVSQDFCSECRNVDVHVRQAAQLTLQHVVGAQHAVELDERHVHGDASQVDCGLDARVAAADHCDSFALVERAVAMWAERHALVEILGLAWHVHVSPASTRGEDDRPRLEGRSAGELDTDEPTDVGCGNESGGALQVDDVDVVLANVLFQSGDELGAFGVGNRDEVLDGHRVEYLAAEPVGHYSSGDAFANCVDRGGGSCWPATDDEYVEGVLVGKLGGRTFSNSRVDLGEQFFNSGATRVERCTIAEHGGDRHDLACVDLGLEECSVDGRVGDVGVEHAHDVERLHHVGAVLATQREVGLELVAAWKVANLFRHGFGDLWRMTSDVQQGKNERSELMPERNASEGNLHVSSGAQDPKRWHARVSAGVAEGNEVRKRSDLVEEFAQLDRLLPRVEGSNELDGMTKVGEMLSKLSSKRRFKHGGLPGQRGGVGGGDGRGGGGVQRDARREWKWLGNRRRRELKSRKRLSSEWNGPSARRRDPELPFGSDRGEPTQQSGHSTGTRTRYDRRGLGRGRGCLRPLPTWQGTLRLGGQPRTGRPSPCAPTRRRCGRCLLRWSRGTG